MAALIIPLCQTCAVWGQASCRLHQGRRGCPGCGGTGRVRCMQVVRGWAIETTEMMCACVEERK